MRSHLQVLTIKKELILLRYCSVEKCHCDAIRPKQSQLDSKCEFGYYMAEDKRWIM